jgi:GNAT superfamily N-acetyltransferase
MRVIRNAGVWGYSSDHTIISEDEQRVWWQKAQHGVYAWLFASNGEVVGYGMMSRREDGRWSPSAGVLPEWQGHGYGKHIVSWLALEAGNMGIELWAQALVGNPAAVRTHDEAYWDKLGEDDTYAYFRSKP